MPRHFIDLARLDPDARGHASFAIHLRRVVVAMGGALLVACGRGGTAVVHDAGENETPPYGGTIIVTTPAEPSSLNPLFADRSNSRQVSDLIFERLADLRPELNTMGDSGFTPVLAESWEWSADSLRITFTLSPNARWHDGRAVTAEDVAFTYALAKDPRVGSYVRENLMALDSVTVVDSLRATFWFARRYPEQFFDAVEHVHVVPAHLLRDIPAAQLRTAAFARAPVGSGPFAFSRWNAGQAVELVANETYHRGRPYLDRVVWTIAPDGTAALSRFLTGEADVYEGLLPEQLPQVESRRDLRVHTAPGLAYAFLGFNFVTADGREHPLFRDRELRRALSRALDRERMVRNVWDSLAVVPRGPFVRAMASLDTTLATLSFDSLAAARTLDSLGWRDSNGDGIRDRGGRPLAFNLLVPSSSAARVRTAVLVQEQFRRLGVQVDVETLEFNAFISRVQRGDYDAYLGAWQLDGSPSTLRQTWFADATDEKGGGNFQSYANPEFEAYADSALHTWSRAERRVWLRRAYEVMVQDAPAVWLYEPLTIVGVHGRVRVPAVPANGWWRELPRWWIPEAVRLPRDRATLAAG